MITHDIQCCQAQGYDVEIDGLISCAFVLPYFVQRIEVEVASLKTEEEVYGDELRPLFLRLRDASPEGVPYVAVLTGGYLDPLPVEDMRTTESAVMFLRISGGAFSSTVDLGEVRNGLSVGCYVDDRTDVEIEAEPLRMRLMDGAAVIGEVVAEPNGTEVFRLVTRSDSDETKVVYIDSCGLDLSSNRLLASCDRELLRILDSGRLAWRSGLSSAGTALRNETAMEAQNLLQLRTGEDEGGMMLDIEFGAEEQMMLTAGSIVAAVTSFLGVQAAEAVLEAVEGLVDMTLLAETDESVFYLRNGEDTEPYLRYFDPRYLAESDGYEVSWMGEPYMRTDLTVVFQADLAASLETGADLEVGP